MFLIPSTPKGPTLRHPHWEAGWGESWKAAAAAAAVEDKVRGDTQRICSRSGEGGPLCVHVRPWMPEQHRHTPSLTRRGGCWGKAKEKKSRAVQRGRERQRMTGRERGGGREWEARWCHICTKPIPEAIVTWPLSPDAFSTSRLASSKHTTVKYMRIIQAVT